jgi:SAM-dependent methyltransferase
MKELGQHNVEIHENSAAWQRKPLLREIYDGFYRRIAAHLPTADLGPVVEIGSGMGNIKRVIPHCITTDLFPNAWLDRQENAYALSYADRSLGAVVLFDVFHHLRYPGTVLRELHRVLNPGGKVILFEPDMGLFGRLVYGKFHHEPLALRDPITWDAPAGFEPQSHGYYAAQGNAHRVFVRGERPGSLDGWTIAHIERHPDLSYVASGGFAGPQLYPRIFLPLLRLVDLLARPLPGAFSTRLLVVLEKNANRTP